MSVAENTYDIIILNTIAIPILLLTIVFLLTYMVPVLVLLFVALWFILRGDLLYVFPCVIWSCVFQSF